MRCAGGKPPLGSSRPTARGRGSPVRSSRMAAPQRPSSAPSSGRSFAAPSGALPSAATPRLGRANTAVPRLLLQSAMLHATQSGGFPSPSDDGNQTAHSAASSMNAAPEAASETAAEVLQLSREDADSASDCSTEDECSSESDSGPEASGGGTMRRQMGPRQDATASKPAAPFHFSGDLDADVAALEALEGASSYYNCDTQRYLPPSLIFLYHCPLKCSMVTPGRV